MKKVITMCLLWMLFVNSSEKGNTPDEFITFLTEENGTTHKCKRIDYLEMIELIEIDTENETKNYNRMRYEESLTYTELLRNKRIEY